MTSRFIIIFGLLLVDCLAVPTPIKPRPNGVGRVIGGTPAGDMSTPYIVALTIGINVRMLMCGGSIITTRHILTAAHCIDAVIGFNGFLYTSLRVIAGTTNWNVGGVAYQATTYYIHEQYDDLRVKNDIGTLTLATDVVMTDRIQLMPLKYDYIGEVLPARITGWGRYRLGGPMSTTLNELIVNTVDGAKCKEMIDRKFIEANNELMRVDPETELCAFKDIGIGICNGDSGSPLTTVDSVEQIGLASWKFECAGDTPSVYTRIGAFENWIKNATSSRNQQK